MNAEHTEYLRENFPSLYRNYGGDMRRTCMVWGFECGDGWFNLLVWLSKCLDPLGIVAAQVKEKFGTLRFYVEGVPSEFADHVYDLIDKAEAKSAKTCEKCGQPGKLRGIAWVTTLCEECVGE